MESISFLRCVLITLVVFIHTNLVVDTACEGSSYSIGYDITGNLLWLANPMFFAISGYLFFFSSKFSWQIYREKMRRRVRTLLIPYLLWNTITLVLYSIVWQLKPSVIGQHVVPIQEMGIMDFLRTYLCVYGEGLDSTPIDGPLWFLRNLIVLSVLSPFFYYIIRAHRLSIILILSLTFMPTDYSTKSSLLYYMLGCYIGIWEGKKAEAGIRPLMGKAGCFIYLVCVALRITLSPHGWSSELLDLIQNLSGMIMLADFAQLILERYPKAIPQLYLNSIFFVFAFHGIIARLLTKGAALYLVSYHVDIGYYPIAHVINALVSISICILLYRITYGISPSLCKILGAIDIKKQ